MSQLIVAVSSLLASGLTQLIKSKKDRTITKSEQESRTRWLKILSAVFSIVLTTLGALLLGDPIDVAGLEGQLEIIASGVLAIIGPQGWYKAVKS